MEGCQILMIFYTFHENGDEILLKIRLQKLTKTIWGAIHFMYLLTNTNIARIKFFMTQHVLYC